MTEGMASLPAEARTPRSAPTTAIERLLAVCLIVVMLLSGVLIYEVQHVPAAVIRDTTSSRTKGRAIACASLRSDARSDEKAAADLAGIERRWGSCDEPGGP